MSTFLHTNLHCLALVARHHGVDLSPERLQHDYAVGDEPVLLRQLLRMAKDAGLRARHVNLVWQSLFQLGEAYPVLAELDNGNWVVIAGVIADGEDEKIRVLDPLAERPEFILLSKEQFSRRWLGSVVLLKRNYRLSDDDQPFGFRWFIPEIIRQRSFFLDVALAAFVLYGLGLTTPIFFQLVIDKVLVHQSYATLTVLTVGIALALVFDATFTFLRRYLLLYATNRIDIRIATRTFGHLLNLPIALFEQASAGVLVKHMQQTGRIREFLTGRLFLTLLDGLSLLVFVPILLLYSVKLTLVVLGFAALVGLVVMMLVGPFQRRLQALYQAEGDRQALLVETVHGMRTVKSLALEPRQRKVWDDYSAQSISVRFRVEKISTAAQAMTGLLEKLMSVAIIGLGALDVFSGAMTIGALVAFNMLAGRVSGPLVQIVTMVHEYQEVALSVRMLGEIMNQRPEQAGRGRGIRPHLRGHIEFDKVTFRYGPDGSPALDNVSFVVPAGSVFGVVGKSGSGKTTITRLIQGLYQNQLRRNMVALTAPADAVVLDLAQRSVGSIVREAEPIVTLVPLNVPLEAEVSINTRDIGRVAAGKEARIKFDAYPFQKYGTASGEVRTVSRDTFTSGGQQETAPSQPVPPFFKARVQLADTRLRASEEPVRLLPGMTVSAEIKVGSRTVISYFLYPLLRGLDDAIREP